MLRPSRGEQLHDAHAAIDNKTAREDRVWANDLASSRPVHTENRAAQAVPWINHQLW